MSTLRRRRMFGDTLFAFGALVLGWFVPGLVTGHCFNHQARVEEGEYTAPPAAAESGDKSRPPPQFAILARHFSLNWLSP
jgi:nitric oxide reductase subunit B